jgi:adenylate cyclase
MRPPGWLQAARLKRALRVAAPFSIAVLSAAVALLGVEHVPFLTHAERFAADFRVASLLPREKQHDDVIVVTINEDTLRLFKYRSPIDRLFLSDLLQRLAARQPRVIAVDILFDQPTDEDKDEALRQTLSDLPVPLVVSFSDRPSIVTDEQLEFMEGFVPAGARAFAHLGEDEFDGTARWLVPAIQRKTGELVPTFAAAVAQKAGRGAFDRATEIAWRGSPQPGTLPFKTYPAHLVDMLPTAWFANKVILLGADLSLTDRHRTPFASLAGSEGFLPGVIVQAEVVAQLLDNRPSPYVAPRIDFLIMLATAAAGVLLGIWKMSLGARVAFAAAAVVVLWGGALLLFRDAGVMIAMIGPTVSLAIGVWATDVLMASEARRQREFIQSAFAQYVSPKVVAQLIADPSRLSLEGERRTMTFIFTDLADFTSLSEVLGSRKLARLLNAYLDGVCNIVLAHDGTVDKFIGDAVFAIFNAPTEQPDHPERAVRCALAIDAFAERFRREQHEKGIPLGATRIGVHTGKATIGNFGSQQRMDFTALGDAVNVASRLEGSNKVFGTRIVVSENTRQQCPSIAFRQLGRVRLKGKTSAIMVFEPLTEERRQSPFIEKYCAAFERLETNPVEALQLFARLEDEEPGDNCVALHLGRLRAGQARGEIVFAEK